MWAFGSVLSFQLERPVFLREQANNLYSPYAYFLAKNVIDTPGAALTPLLQLFMTYWFIDFKEFGKLYLILIIIS